MNEDKNNETVQNNTLNESNVSGSNFFICSESVIKHFKEVIHSKPFKSGFVDENDNNYVAKLDFDSIEKYYQEHEEELESENFWCRECTPGTMDVSKITLAGMRRNGIFYEIMEKLNITSTRNQAMTICELSNKYNCTPIELINKIIK